MMRNTADINKRHAVYFDTPPDFSFASYDATRSNLRKTSSRILPKDALQKLCMITPKPAHAMPRSSLDSGLESASSVHTAGSHSSESSEKELTQEMDDEASTWAFLPSSKKSQVAQAGDVEQDSLALTDAQRIVSEYRTRHSGDDWSVTGLVEKGPVIRRRDSQSAEFVEATFLAIGEMRRCRLGEYNRLVCPIRGCRDTVKNVNALVYHIHLHIICIDDDQQIVCESCNGRYSTEEALSKHVCPVQVMSAPTTPTQGSFGIKRRRFNSISRLTRILTNLSA